MEKININGTIITGERIMTNIWGGQVEVILTTWEEIRRLGFEVRDRAFGNLNDGTPALYFYGLLNTFIKRDLWFVTTEKLGNIKD